MACLGVVGLGLETIGPRGNSGEAVLRVALPPPLGTRGLRGFPKLQGYRGVISF